MGKIYSQILLNRLNKWAETEEKNLDSQFGFQKGKSTVDCIFTFYSIIIKTLSQGENYIAFLLISKKLLIKLTVPFYGKNFYLKISVVNLSVLYVPCIMSSNRVLDTRLLLLFVSSYNGLKQGDPSSPLLFMLFINDIVQNINVGLDQIFTVDDMKLFLMLYADDAVVFAKSPIVLQSILYVIDLYCTLWGLKINTAKTKAMIFEKGRHTHYDFYLNNVKLEIVTSFKYLGMYFFKNGNWNRTQKRLSQHAAFALHNLFSLFRQIEFTTSQKCKLFDVLVGSILRRGVGL